MSDFDLVLTGRVVGTDRVRENGYVAIRGGLVERVGKGSPPSAVRREDFGLDETLGTHSSTEISI